jgi:hypothetical protein
MVLLKVIKGKYDFLGGSLHLLYIGLVLEKRKKETLKI